MADLQEDGSHSTDDESEYERMEDIIQEREESPVPRRFLSVSVCIPVRQDGSGSQRRL
jgi:hypothetical protein